MADPSSQHTDGAAIAAKLAVVWTGTLFGIKLSDLVLLATLLYTVLQIGIVIWDRIVKPIMNRSKEKHSG